MDSTTDAVRSGVGGRLEPYYNANGIALYHGDCMKLMPLLPADSFDVTLTSPPYNLGGEDGPDSTNMGHASSKWRGSKIQDGYADHADAMPHAEYCEWQKAVLNECWRLTRGAIYYNHKPRPVNGEIRLPLEWWPLPLRQIITWFRGSGFNFSTSHYMPTSEWVLLGAKPDFRLKNRGASGVGDVWQIPPEINTEHPAPFPLNLAGRVLETSGAQSVFDPFAGSGTTLVAARLAGIKGVGCELSERYCEIIARRLAQDVLPLSSGGGAEPVGEQLDAFEHSGAQRYNSVLPKQ